MMKIPDRVEKIFHKVVDFWFAIWPQPFPGQARMRHCKIVSHRGAHDNKNTLENTLEAFERAHAAGVWGLEFDVRWTLDQKPVVVHDYDLVRVFGINAAVDQLSLQELQSRCPLIPSLREVLRLYGGAVHLMVEIKAQDGPDQAGRSRVLQEHFNGLVPQRDYHLLSLTPSVLERLDWCPPAARLPVAQLNVAALSNVALSGGYGGLNGHYLLITKTVLQKHHHHGQSVGCGYVRSRNSLFRELNRGVDWIYSNNALELQRIRNSFLR
jgi:glycerophosphoryl diester phosphodiesterase